MPPAIAAAAPALAAAIPAITGAATAAGSFALGGKGNTYEAREFGNSQFYDPNRYEYGGRQGGAAEAAAGYGNMGLSEREAASHFYGLGQEDRARGLEARASQEQAAALMMARARGEVPSIAQQMADRNMQQAVASQQSMQASARGPAALALAQQNAANNIANAQSGISGQAQIAAAQERLAAEQAAMGAYGNIRQGDAQQQGLVYGVGNQRGQNALGYHNLENAVNRQQLEAQLQQQRIMSGTMESADALNARIRSENVKRDDDRLERSMGIFTKMGQGGGMAMGGMGGGAAPSSGASSGGSSGTGSVPGGGNF